MHPGRVVDFNRPFIYRQHTSCEKGRHRVKSVVSKISKAAIVILVLVITNAAVICGQRAMAGPLGDMSEWLAPIKFYGKVIDENARPVANANVRFVWNDISLQGTSEKNTRSDSNGFFSLSTRGKCLTVRVSKDGYYTYEPAGKFFFYAGENVNFVPDKAKPIIFRLKKKGVAEPLFAVGKFYSASMSGKPLGIDLKTGQIAPKDHGDIIVEYVKQRSHNPANNLYDWTLKVTVPNGGLIVTPDEYGFIAPPSGYQPSDLVDMKASAGNNWQGNLERRYFFKLPDGTFARATFDFMSHNGGLKLEAFLNPTGSRNLEFDSKKKLNSP